MADPDRRLRVSIVDGRGRTVRVPGLASWLARVAPRGAHGEITIALVTDARMRTLNRAYRKRDYATDVLSFPVEPEPAKPGTPRHLGDILISRGVAASQARAAGHPLGTELRILALHGLLHLMGYDHERDHGRMRRLEIRLRRKGGLGEGLIERAR